MQLRKPREQAPWEVEVVVAVWKHLLACSQLAHFLNWSADTPDDMVLLLSFSGKFDILFQESDGK